MARQPKLRKKTVGESVHWYTKAGGDTYFGSVDAVPYSEAKKLFNDHVKILEPVIDFFSASPAFSGAAADQEPVFRPADNANL